MIIASEVVQSSAYVFSGTGRIFQRSTMRWLRIMDCNYFYCPLVFIECKVLWDNLFGVLINQEGNLPWMVGLRFGWTN